MQANFYTTCNASGKSKQKIVQGLAEVREEV